MWLLRLKKPIDSNDDREEALDNESMEATAAAAVDRDLFMTLAEFFLFSRRTSTGLLLRSLAAIAMVTSGCQTRATRSSGGSLRERQFARVPEDAGVEDHNLHGAMPARSAMT